MARLNENENENESSGGGRDGLFAGGRFNTYKIAKQAFNPTPPDGRFPRAPRSPKYDDVGGWDAENKGWIYLVEFTQFRSKWFADLLAVAETTWSGWADTGKLDTALADILDAAGEREDRFAECFHQQDAEGCISYWMATLGIDKAKQPNTYQLIRVGRKIGEMIVMCLKAHFNAARPSQICPAIVPMFDPPRTASYPAGHALQSYLISYLLLRVMPNLPQSARPEKTEVEGKTIRAWETQHQGLFALARRVADNRVIAGVHYDIDSEAGFLIAREIDIWLRDWCSDWFDGWCNDTAPYRGGSHLTQFAQLLKAARKEFPQFDQTT